MQGCRDAERRSLGSSSESGVCARQPGTVPLKLLILFSFPTLGVEKLKVERNGPEHLRLWLEDETPNMLTACLTPHVILNTLLFNSPRSFFCGAQHCRPLILMRKCPSRNPEHGDSPKQFDWWNHDQKSKPQSVCGISSYCILSVRFLPRRMV